MSLKPAVRQIILSKKKLWDLDLISPNVWLSLHPQASQQSQITIATGVSAATDASGNNLNFSQGTGANQPAYASTVFNGFPALSFDGTNDTISSNFILSGDPAITFVIVYRRTDISKGSPFSWGTTGSPNAGYGVYGDSTFTGISLSGGVAYQIPQANFPNNTALILSGSKPSGALNLSTAIVNGSSITPVGTPSSNTPAIAASPPLSLGAWGSFMLQGHIAEFAAFNRVLATDELQRLHGILAHRWWRLGGVSVPLPSTHPFFSNPPTR